MKLKDKYTKEIVPVLKEKLGYKSVMQVPKLKKITKDAHRNYMVLGFAPASGFDFTDKSETTLPVSQQVREGATDLTVQYMA